MNSERIINSIFDDIIHDFVKEESQKAEIERKTSIICDLAVEHVVCNIFDDRYYNCIKDTVECINLEREVEEERVKRIDLMVEYAVQEVFKEMLEDQLDDAQARQRVSSKLFAEHSVSQIEMPPPTPVLVIVQQVCYLCVCVTD